ncbi:MAG: N-terminal phage integrase SAM-like domain-containing protein, partial [Chloroflexota bacterium]|nr:N-terminal phage integrase SAM-like domain-containing protein [Chloroflexota bacterium]
MPEKQQDKRKRANGDGSYSKRPDGRWMGQAYIDGRRRTVYARTRREAQVAIEELRAESRQGIITPPGRVTVESHIAAWLRDIVQPTVRPATYRSYAQLARLYVLPAFGAVKLRELQPAHLQRLYRELTERGLSAHT